MKKPTADTHCCFPEPLFPTLIPWESPALWLITWLALATLALLLAAPPGARAAAVQLPATGQTLCYDQVGAVLPCAGTGQDGETRAGAAWPAPRFTDNLDGTVTDQLSGLIWLKNVDCSDIQSTGGSDWSTALKAAAALHSGQCLLTDNSKAGDWRLPNVNELESLIDLSRSYPALPVPNFFLNVEAIWFWSSTSQAVYPNNAEAVDAGTGSIRGDTKISNASHVALKYAWPVRGSARNIARTGQSDCWDPLGNPLSCTGTGADGEQRQGTAWPVPRFSDGGDGTLTDNLTGLIWLKQGDCYGFTASPSDALAAVRLLASGSCNLGDRSVPGNWRLPNRKEMRSLVNYGAVNGADWLNSQGFSNVQDGWYWTSDSFPGMGDKWVVKTEGGAWISGWLSQLVPAQPQYLLPVRGPSAVRFTLVYGAGPNGSIVGQASQTVVPGGSGTQVTAVPASGYHFVSWSDGVTVAARTDSNVRANISVSASFAANGYTLKYLAGANGGISGNAAQTVSAGGSGTKVSAVANTGYHFVSWSDGVTSAARTDSNVKANISVTASFAANTFTVTFVAGSHGSIHGATSQTVSYGGSSATVTAVPASGYRFISWTDANSRVLSNSASFRLTNVTSNQRVTANFSR